MMQWLRECGEEIGRNQSIMKANYGCFPPSRWDGVCGIGGTRRMAAFWVAPPAGFAHLFFPGPKRRRCSSLSSFECDPLLLLG